MSLSSEDKGILAVVGLYFYSFVKEMLVITALIGVIRYTF